MKTFYAPNYVNSDGITKENYFELVKKTWKLYPDIKYTMNITNIDIIGNTAVVETKENADATSVEKVGDANITGYLKSNSLTASSLPDILPPLIKVIILLLNIIIPKPINQYLIAKPKEGFFLKSLI